MKAMVLCAGLGTRLRPITYEIPKPLVPFFGEPVVGRIFKSLSSAGITESVVNLYHLPEKVKKTLGSSMYGVSISYSMEDKILGAVGALRQAIDQLGDEPFIVVNGDIVIDADVSGLIRRHKESGADMTMALGRISGKEQLHVAGCANDGRVVRIRDAGNGEEPVEWFVNLGLFVYEPEIIKKYVPYGVPFGFVDGIIPLMYRDGKKIMSYVMSGYWNDIGTPEDYLRAHKDAMDGQLGPDFDGGTGKFNNTELTWISETAEISSDSYIGKYTFVGSGAVVESGAKLSDVVVMNGARVAGNQHISGGIYSRVGYIPV